MKGKNKNNNVVSWGLFFFYLIVGQTIAQQNPWQLVDDALAKGIKTKGYPGAVALVGDETVRFSLSSENSIHSIICN